MKSKLLFFLFLLASVCGWGQINYVNGTAITENFNGLGASSTLPTNWKVSKSTVVRTSPGTYSSAGNSVERAGGNNMSSGAQNGIYRFNANNDTNESAIGGLSSASGSKSVFVYTHLRNNGTTATNSFNISYDAERYRNGTNTAGFSITLFYSTNGTD